ncbi:uncharacterized protein LOC114881447 [Osmia bicornis bicornis]|uniref:uncharacterized protein LOC114881447 n=1 Tax=Osmia bicornis bicornis TaxID=1437191 RepID=UPI0010F98F60|nr:uncharacterized protein LOC114881447 [Osmia bicornis bicornis]XP_046143076.1 uncharacterized protein LOC114881447 [Osmia bicornis bicornis]
MFTLPPGEKDKERMMQWVEACDNPILSLLPPEKLKYRVVCSSHFESKYIMTKKLTTSAVPTLNVSGKPDCTGGVDDKSGIVGHVEYTALPGPSREIQCNDLDRLSLKEEKPLHNGDCAVPGREHQRSQAQKGNILKMLRAPTRYC